MRKLRKLGSFQCKQCFGSSFVSMLIRIKIKNLKNVQLKKFKSYLQEKPSTLESEHPAGKS
jgi:hypothetical protein